MWKRFAVFQIVGQRGEHLFFCVAAHKRENLFRQFLFLLAEVSGAAIMRRNFGGGLSPDIAGRILQKSFDFGFGQFFQSFNGNPQWSAARHAPDGISQGKCRAKTLTPS